MRKFFGLLLLGLAALPVSFLVTFLLFPFWGWLEASTGIESVGHSGPADWCFVAVFGVTVTVGGVAWFIWQRKRGAGDEDKSGRGESSA